MSKIKIIDAKIIGFCSKCRSINDEIHRFKDGAIVPDKDIECLCCAFKDCKHKKEDNKK